MPFFLGVCRSRAECVLSISGNAWGRLQQEASGLTLPFLLSKRSLGLHRPWREGRGGLILDPGLRGGRVEKEREHVLI